MKPMFITATPLGPSLPVRGPSLGWDEENPAGEEWVSEDTGDDYTGYDIPDEQTEEDGGGFDLSQVFGLMSTIEGLIAKVPSNLLGPYKTEFERCKQMATSSSFLAATAGAACLYNLYKKVASDTGVTPSIKPPTVSKGSPFPIVPVAIGAVALTGLGLILFLPRS